MADQCFTIFAESVEEVYPIPSSADSGRNRDRLSVGRNEWLAVARPISRESLPSRSVGPHHHELTLGKFVADVNDGVLEIGRAAGPDIDSSCLAHNDRNRRRRDHVAIE